ncbi:MAG TPA: HAMP domain-containing sensor histidine kinase [Ruminococcus sp.]|nr:HAMP domain-containing sensor histidine kinase [Ruminococcus sp.]
MHILIILSIILAVITIIMSIRFIELKTDIKRFSEYIENNIDSGSNSFIKTTSFDHDAMELAVRINELMKIRHDADNIYEQNNQQLNNIISGIAHDFRTPLTASIGYLQMIEKSGLLSGQHSIYLDSAIKKNQYLKHLSDDLFEFLRFENELQQPELENINLGNLVMELALDQYQWIEEKKITPSFDIDETIIIKTEKHYLTRIINNLISNAQKYTTDRFGISLQRNGERAELRFFNSFDESSSIDKDKLFDPFYRSFSRTEPGTGLGLYVVKTLAEKLEIIVSSDITEDATFEITLSFATEN